MSERRVCRAPERMLHADIYLTVRRALSASLAPGPAGRRAGKPHLRRLQVRIDGGAPATYDPGALAKNGNFRHVQMIARGLSADREHLVEIRPLLGEGRELRIESVCVAGAPATVEIVRSEP